MEVAYTLLRHTLVHYSDGMLHDDIDLRIGARIRAERETRGWSLTELADRAKVSRAMIHKVERGDSSPTANLLGKLSGAFGLSMSTLLARAEAAGGDLLRKDDQPVWTDPETGYIRRQVSPKSDMPLDLVEVTLPAGKEVPMPASAYAFIRQLIWVLAGDLVFAEGPVRHELHAGDCLHLGPPEDCVFRNEGNEPCTYAVAVLRDG
ncbi:helix-turn-helix domain-containing protein [Psychromarinibacter sp. S121]|uniref:helix-turn-helix domain-containing protein n=1 Tax=Psychromarinibacter sp. S121 TaxID=3415127 RepID=UPI003C7A1888